MKGAGIIILFFLINSLLFAQQNSTHEYKKGIEALAANDTTAAMAYFKESIKFNNDAASYYQAGMIELSKNVFTNSDYLKTAAELEPGNLTYRLAYSKLVERTNWDAAVAVNMEITNDFPNCIEPNLFIANYFLVKYYTERNCLLYKGSNLFIYPEEEVKEYYQSSENSYLKALTVSPSNIKALAGIASLYFNSPNPDKAIPYLKQITGKGPGYTGAHIMLASIYNMAGQNEIARLELKTALEFMDQEEKEIYTYSSALELLKPVYQINLHYDLKSEIEAMIKRFWKTFNPPGGKSDEREFEHYLRVAYSNLMFGNPKKGMKGWESERGKVYICFGAPDSIVSIRAFRKHPRTQVWHYKDFKLSFSEYDNDGNYYFSGIDQGNKYCVPNSYQIFEEKRNEKIQSFTPKGKYGELNSGAFFFGASDQNNQEIYLGYLFAEMPELASLKSPLNDFDFTLQIYDDEFEQVVETPISFSLVRKRFGKKVTPGSAGIINFPVPVTRGILLLNGVNINDSSRFSFHQYFDNSGLSDTELSVNNILIASDLETDLYMSGAIKRERVSFIPERQEDIKPGSNSFLYFEINGLKDGNEGKYEFTEEISIVRVQEKNPDPDLLELFGNLFKFIFKKNTKYNLYNSYYSKKNSVNQFYKIDLSGYEPGRYEITVLINDKVSGKKIERLSFFEVKK